MPGDGSSLIQPIWIEDLVMSLVLALEDPKTVNQVYEVGGMEFFTFRSIIEMIMDASRRFGAS
jgi:nucleoside-diphosphate-sugar epimerase